MTAADRTQTTYSTYTREIESVFLDRLHQFLRPQLTIFSLCGVYMSTHTHSLSLKYLSQHSELFLSHAEKKNSPPPSSTILVPFLRQIFSPPPRPFAYYMPHSTPPQFYTQRSPATPKHSSTQQPSSSSSSLSLSLSASPPLSLSLCFSPSLLFTATSCGQPCFLFVSGLCCEALSVSLALGLSERANR